LEALSTTAIFIQSLPDDKPQTLRFSERLTFTTLDPIEVQPERWNAGANRVSQMGSAVP
jgi:hypothetical protein